MSEDLVYFYPEGHKAHSFPGHPERPERLQAIRQGLQEVGWWNQYPKLSPIPVPMDILLRVHDKNYIEDLKTASSHSQWLDPDTYTTQASWDLALHALGGTLAVSSYVWSANAKKGFALARPPGHHATRNRGMGFCLLNNIAVAAEYLICAHGVKRIAIIDLDLHHGNGTQDIFYQRGDVFFLSIHQSPLYPLTGNMNEEGYGQGEGTTFNLPMPPGSGDQAYRHAVSEIVLPLLDEFSPEIVLVSYGFDAHWLDPLGSILLSAKAYHDIFNELTRWSNHKCNGKMVVVLEGGYDLVAASICSQAVVASLLDSCWKDPIGLSKSTETDSWKVILEEAKTRWIYKKHQGDDHE